MATDCGSAGRSAGNKRMDAGFHWVSSAPSPAEVASLEEAFPEVVRLPVADLEAEAAAWRSNAILARSYQRWVPAAAIIRELRRAGIQGEISSISLAFRCHIIRFEDPSASDLVLQRPWVVNGQIIGTERWRPEFVPAVDAVPSALLWVRLPNLPMEFWREDFIKPILEVAGQFICVDASTQAKIRGGFARACIRVDLSLPLRPGARIQGTQLPFWQQFAYECLEGVCSHCGALHLKGSCHQSEVSGVVGGGPSLAFGPWIAAVRQRRDFPGLKQDGRRKSQAQQDASYGDRVAQKQQPLGGDSARESGGWSVPVKVARRRVPSSSKEPLSPAKGMDCAEAEVSLNGTKGGGVPAQSKRAGSQPTVSGLREAERGGFSSLGLC